MFAASIPKRSRLSWRRYEYRHRKRRLLDIEAIHDAFAARALLRHGRSFARRGAGAVVRLFRPPVVPGPPPEPTRVTLEQLAAFNGEKSVVFFAPEAGVVPHYMAHCLVAKSLKERGHRVLIIRCFDVYPRCVVMDAAALAMEPTEQERLVVCASWRDSADNMAGAYGLDVLDLQDLIDEEARKTVDRLMANLPEDISWFKIEGARLGQFCSAMAAVTFKVTDFTGADPAVRSLMMKYLRGSLLSYLAMQRLARINAGITPPHLLQPIRNPDGGGACCPPGRIPNNQSVACDHTPRGGSSPYRFHNSGIVYCDFPSVVAGVAELAGLGLVAASDRRGR